MRFQLFKASFMVVFSVTSNYSSLITSRGFQRLLIFFSWYFLGILSDLGEEFEVEAFCSSPFFIGSEAWLEEKLFLFDGIFDDLLNFYDEYIEGYLEGCGL
jgi:hypothetical protein